jgi:hypothetical protein
MESIAMQRWRQNLKRTLQEALEDDDCEEMLLGFLLGPTADTPVKKHGWSRPGRAANLERDRESGHNRLCADYFSTTPTHDAAAFRRRYRMRRGLFLRILEGVTAYDSYFVQKRDAAGVLGLSSIQKCTAALRMLVYGAAADATDEYCRLGESTAFEAMKRFVKAIRACFESTYLRQPSRADVVKQMNVNEGRGFPGMFASIDCMHWRWKNCPAAWQGHSEDKDKNRSFILEAIVDQSLWIWYAYIGLPRDKNDVSLLDRSPLVREMLKGEAGDLGFSVNGTLYPRYYLLADEVYPGWSCFVKTIEEPQDEMEQHFVETHEAVRKDVEQCFGVLQSRFAIIQNPCRQWHMDTISDIMRACVIMHNMIIEDESGCNLEALFEHSPTTQMRRGLTFEDDREATEELENSEAHFALRSDLIEHLWALKDTNFY